MKAEKFFNHNKIVFYTIQLKGKLANYNTVENERLGSFSFLLAFFLFLTQEKEKSETMFFLHPDHLGSVNMITDGFGNLITGGNMGGKSSINYKPYGEIHRTDSGGPDVSKFKYTGQEEDKESGLYFYKARYYDANVGRFIQADSEVDTQTLNGLNRYMYVQGKTINKADVTGNRFSPPVAYALLEYFTNPPEKRDEAAKWGFLRGMSIEKAEKEEHDKHILSNNLKGFGAFLVVLGAGFATFALSTGILAKFAWIGVVVAIVGVVFMCAGEAIAEEENNGYQDQLVISASYSQTFDTTKENNNPQANNQQQSSNQPQNSNNQRYIPIMQYGTYKNNPQNPGAYKYQNGQLAPAQSNSSQCSFSYTKEQ